MNKLIYIFILMSTFQSCDTELCKIDYESHHDSFEKALVDIHSLGIEKESKAPYFRIVKSFNKTNYPFGLELFDEIELIECHEDGTIFFQAPNCNSGSAIRDGVNFVVYSPKGIDHVKGKRSVGKLIELKENWYKGRHVNSIAN